jgi:hypothetical protein
MEIKYAKFHRWYKPVIAEPAELFGAKIKKRVYSSLERISDTNIVRVDIKPLTQDYIDWFTPLYESMLQTKDKAVVHDIYQSTLGNQESESEYWSLTLYENDLKVGGTIFGVRDEKIMTAFKTYNYSWNELTLQAGPTILAEYYLCKHAFDVDKKQISHGKDRNPYGINAAIGLATFKLSLGYQANILETSDDYTCTTLETNTIDEDSLIFHYPMQDQEITEATLITAKDSQSKYAQLLSYTDKMKIHTVIRD